MKTQILVRIHPQKTPRRFLLRIQILCGNTNMKRMREKQDNIHPRKKPRRFSIKDTNTDMCGNTNMKRMREKNTRPYQST